MLVRILAVLLFALSPLYALQTENASCQTFEEKVAKEPDDTSLRVQLAQCYFRLQYQSGRAGRDPQQAQSKRDDQLLWLIQHKPEDPYLGTAEAALQPRWNEASSSQLKDAWLQQAKAHPTDAHILFNAATSLMLVDFDPALSFAEKAHSLDPSNKEISFRLGQFYALKMHGAEPAQKAQIARKALPLKEDALNGATGEERFVQLSDLAESALQAEDEVKAQKYAEEALATAPQYPKSWAYGNAIHHGNLVMGRIALRHGDLVEAKSRLLKAGNTPGSPQLDTFGPNMALAKELLEKREKDVVLDYFAECEKFWQMRGNKLTEWTALVKQDRMPDFGGNLFY